MPLKRLGEVVVLTMRKTKDNERCSLLGRQACQQDHGSYVCNASMWCMLGRLIWLWHLTGAQHVALTPHLKSGH